MKKFIWKIWITRNKWKLRIKKDLKIEVNPKLEKEIII